MFADNKYRLARHCFHRASLPDCEQEANAHLLREEAKRLSAATKTDQVIRARAFLRAAKEFESCAGVVQNLDVKNRCFHISAECFEETEDKSSAAGAYLQCRQYARAVELWASIGKFNRAIETMNEYPVTESLRESVATRARLHFFKRHELK